MVLVAVEVHVVKVVMVKIFDLVVSAVVIALAVVIVVVVALDAVVVAFVVAVVEAVEVVAIATFIVASKAAAVSSGMLEGGTVVGVSLKNRPVVNDAVGPTGGMVVRGAAAVTHKLTASKMSITARW